MPRASTGEAKAPVVETIWWFWVSSLRQRIESPATMLTVAGENAARLIETVFVVAAVAGDDGHECGDERAEDEECASHAPSIPLLERSLSALRRGFTESVQRPDRPLALTPCN